MKKLPVIEKSCEKFHHMITAPIHSRLLMAGIELGVFDEMISFTPAGDVASALGTHAGNTGRFLNALTTIGLLKKKNGLYRNLPDTSEFLVKESPAYIGDFLQMVQGMCVEPLDDLTGLVKDGPRPSDSTDFSSPELWAAATRTSAKWVISGSGARMASIVSGLPEFPRFRRMLDLGGGHGMFALYFIDAHPDMTGVVFDRPAVVSVAGDYIREYGMEDRISVLAGDYLADDIGAGYDFIWACSTLNFARHDLDALFTKIFNALNEDGVFISFQDGMTHEQTRPDVMLGHLGSAMQEDRDMFFEQGEIADAMLRCGFRSVRSRTVKTPMGEMDLDIARK